MKTRYGRYQHYCLDCNTKISRGALRCISCGRRKAKKSIWSIEKRNKRKGNNNPNWKGDNVSYKGLHDWLRRNKEMTALCEDCKKEKPIDFANVSGKYKRDVNDFICVCRHCHMKSDGRLLNLKQNIINKFNCEVAEKCS